MTLKEYILTCDKDAEITVVDKTTGYSCGYFYNEEVDPDEEWFVQIDRLAQKLTVEDAGNHRCTVNMFELMQKAKDDIIAHHKFYSTIPISWMESMHAIIAGNVSEAWLKGFVDLL